MLLRAHPAQAAYRRLVYQVVKRDLVLPAGLLADLVDHRRILVYPVQFRQTQVYLARHHPRIRVDLARHHPRIRVDLARHHPRIRVDLASLHLILAFLALVECK